MIAEIIMAALVLLGGFFCFVAGLGVLRLPDVLIRMHASTKAGTLGSGLILVAVAIYFADTATTTRAVATILFLLITAPVAAHTIGRAAFRSGVALWNTKIEEKAERELSR
ncbi:monovalent cation/H(+) antiporter subunit G [Roseibacterium sp. SDUM158017]|uniref:monovalent cation/H(+) antiporter subunit G n=1 Tax=Roseicyclus salinarum TaxID=3036773 RepID=UPI0024154122|nr:monovalent cation/H(+) antiporter subunit G [Roseibacterium sp. SDUM158017]MDG4649586.1 monovalent cation/H(+) antiporter subunit G [Roseibacterium sp. SDUM158017]